jgi:hypothetical protein
MMRSEQLGLCFLNGAAVSLASSIFINNDNKKDGVCGMDLASWCAGKQKVARATSRC